MIRGALPGRVVRNGMPVSRPYLPPAQRVILTLLAGQERMPIRTLARQAGRDIGAVRQAVAGLCLIAMARTETQGSATWVVITPEGRHTVTLAATAAGSGPDQPGP